MSRTMVVLTRLSKAVDSRNIREVLLALQSIDDGQNIEECEDTFAVFLHEIVTWNLKESAEISESVIRHLISFLKTVDTLKRACVKILKYQAPVAVQIAVEIMTAENWMLTQEECREVWKRIELFKNSEILNEKTVNEYLSRVTANSMILRKSGTPNRFSSKILTDALSDTGHIRYVLPKLLLNELALVVPFHPLTIIEDLKNSDDVFLVPRVIAVECRFRLEIDELVKFLNQSSSYQKEHARSFLSIFRSICRQMDAIELMEADELERIVDFWISCIGIFDGHGIGLDDITEAAKLIEKTTSRFLPKIQPLFLKHFLRKLSEKKDSSTGFEPQIVATIITTFQRAAFSSQSPDFYEELGEFWTLCMKMKYDDIYYSTVFYSSVFALAQAQAIFRVKKELCREVYVKILQPMHQQIVDFIKLKNAESNKEMSDAEKLLSEQRNVGSSYFSIITCTYKNAEDRILEFINQD